MSYIGSSATPIPVAFSGVRTQSFSGNGSTSLFTLNRAVTLVTDIEVIVNNVQQSPFDGSYSLINNGLGLQFSENVSAGTNNIYVVYRDQPMGSLYDQGAVRKAGDVMIGGLSLTGLTVTNQNYPQVLLNSGAGGVRDWLLFTDAVAGGLGTGSFNIRDNTASANRLVLDSVGRLTVPNQPMAAIGANYSYSPANGSYTKCLYTSVQVNVGNCYNPSTGNFTCPVAGRYLVSSSIHSDAGREPRHYVAKNDVFHRGTTSTGPGWHNGCLSAIIECAAGDTLSLWAYGLGSTYLHGDAAWSGWNAQLLS
jgi:hypothetical protein